MLDIFIYNINIYINKYKTRRAMKRIFLVYAGGFLLSLFFGGVVSVSYHYSWWLLFFLAIPISFGYVLLSDLYLRINAENLRKVTILTVVALLVMFGFLVAAAYYHLDETSLYGMACAGGVICYIVGLAIIGMGLPKRWEEKRFERKVPY